MSTHTYLITAKEAASRLGVHPMSLEQWRRRYRETGELIGPPWVIIGVGAVRYDRADLERYIYERKLAPGINRER